MTVIDRADIQSHLISNSLSDNTHVYSSDESYSISDIVQFDGYIYKSLADENLGNQPDISIQWENWDSVNGVRFPVKFPTNDTRLFDYYSQTVSVAENEVVLEIENNFFDYIGGYNIEADTVQVIVADSDGVEVFNETKEMKENPIWDWYDWTYWMPVDRESSFNFHLPIAPVSTIKVIFKGSIVKIGLLEVGTSKELGCSLTGIDLFFKSGKKYTRDEDSGIIFLDENLKGNYKEIKASVYIQDYKKTDKVLTTLYSLINKPTTFIVDDRDSDEVRKAHYSLFGIIDEVSNKLNTNYSEYSIVIKGV